MFVEFPSTGFQKLFQHAPDAQTALKHPKQSASNADHARILDLLFSQPWPAAQGGANEREVPGSLSKTDQNINTEDVGKDHPLPDARVIISQEGTVTAGPRVLFDSKPTKHPISSKVPRHLSRFEHRRSHSGHELDPGAESHFPRRRSVSAVQEHRANSSFMKESKTRFLGLSSDVAPGRKPAYSALTNTGKLQRDVEQVQDDDANEIVECVFGNSGLPSATSTKFHIRPPKETFDHYKNQSQSNLPEVQGRSGSTLCAQHPSTSPARPRKEHAAVGHDAPTSATELLTLLVTRIFAIDMSVSKNVQRDLQLSEPLSTCDTTSKESYQHYTISDGVEQGGKTVCHRLPKYAVTLVMNVPISSVSELPSFVQPDIQCIDGTHVPYDHGMQYIMGHWVNVMRGLHRLEALARSQISQRLHRLYDQAEDSGSLAQKPETTSDNALSQSKPKSRHKYQRSFHLAAAVLQEDKVIQNHTVFTVQKLLAAFRIRRVAITSKHWGAWKHEARLLSSHLGGKPQNFFLFNVLTAFLGTQVNWLDSLAPRWWKQRRRNNVAAGSSEDIIINRTILVCPNGDVGRQMVYVLAMFMPMRKSVNDRSRFHSMSPCSNLSMSQSPPFLSPSGREPSLRRSIGRRAGASMLSSTKGTVALAASKAGTVGSPGTLQHPRNGRRLSDTRSIHSLAVSVPQEDSILRKSSAGVVSATVPIRQVSTFAAPSPRGTSAEPRPGSSGSLAALSLQRTLSRSESSNLGSPTSPSQSRWGSVMSGFWSLGRRSSTEQSKGPGSLYDGLGITGLQKAQTDARQFSEVIDEDQQVIRHRRLPIAASEEPLSPTAVQFESKPLPSSTPLKDIPLPVKIEEYPLRFSVDEEDGVVDIELPPEQSYPSSLESSNTDTAASSLNDHVSTYTRHSSPPRQQGPINELMEIAGYLDNYHPDFLLQAVRPYWRLKSDVIRSLRDEAAQSYDSPRCFSALIADATTFTVIQLTLDDDTIKEEPIMDLDPIFVDAVERLIMSDDEAEMDKGCKKAIWSALETVVKDVIAEEEGGEAQAGTDDNILREGVRRWIRERRVAH